MKSIMCAAGVLLKDDKILLGRRHSNRDFYPKVWDLPGGHCKGIETPDEILIRELKEELGVTITEFKYLTLLHEPNKELYGEHDYHIYLVIDWFGTVINLSPDEHSELRWFDLHEAIHLKLAHPDYPALFEKASGSFSHRP